MHNDCKQSSCAVYSLLRAAGSLSGNYALAACAYPQHEVLVSKSDCVMALARDCHLIVPLHAMQNLNLNCFAVHHR